MSRHCQLITLVGYLLSFIAFCAIEPLKHRFVYPRTGYVSPGQPKDRRVDDEVIKFVGLILALALIASLIFWLRNASDPLPLATLAAATCIFQIGMGVVFAAVYGLLFLRCGFLRYLIIACISTLTPILLVSTHSDFRYRYVFWWSVLGISLIVAGAHAFMKILRIPVATQQDVE